ncbi:MAG: hypothetical protein ABSA65_15235 [Acidimicrobiales bacterium]|jgi:hypothetical protein
MPTDAATLLRVAYVAGAVVDAAAAIEMALPERFGARLRYGASFDVGRAEFRYGMRQAAALMAGWTVLLVWAFLDPVARRDVLLITIVPVIVGLMGSDALAQRRGELRRGPVLAVRSMQLVLIALFAAAYVVSAR